MSDPKENMEVGKRVAFEDHFGTIRYVGEVPPTKGVWLGVEWDDPQRGKHSGTHEGVEYFSCSVEGSGSFLRHRRAELGCTFIQAVRERYIASKGQTDDEDMYMGTKPVIMVGWDKAQSELEELGEVSLRGMLVSSEGPPDEISSTTPSIVRLDLSQNQLLPDWKVVSEIAAQLSLLTSMDLSDNKHLHIPVDPLPHTCFSCLKSLFLNKMALTWDKICVVLRMVPELEELHACENKITDVRIEDGSANHLILLNLEENQLSSWNSVQRLGVLKRMKMLILNDNKLKSIESDLSPGDFPVLECLCLSKNSLTHWTSVNSLAQFPSLTDLKFKENPIHNDEPVFPMRQLLIARLPQLNSLNNSAITPKERQLAERYYLKRYSSDYAGSRASDALQSQFLQMHPRYTSLVTVHGPCEDETPQGSKGQSQVPLKAGLLSVTLCCPDDPSKEERVRKVPASMTVQKLKGLIQRLYKISSSEQTLSYQSKEVSHEIELTDGLRQVSFYSVQDGDRILIRW